MRLLIKQSGFFVLLICATLIFWMLDFSPLAFYVLFASSLSIAFILERYIPFQIAWNIGRQDIGNDVAYAILNILTNPLLKMLTLFLVTKINELIPLGNLHHFILSLPLSIQVLCALIISGFLPYWYHRISHTKNNFLWKVHSIHHASERLYWLNAFRFHPLNAILNIFLASILLLLFGFSNEVILLVGFVNNYVAIFNHANIDFRLGAFNYIFNMNELHRWHHSKKMEEANNNYSGGALIFWDIVFGTYYNPAKKIGPCDVGLFDNSKKGFPYISLVKQLCYPFCRCRR